jgi:5'-3' exonuclease
MVVSWDDLADIRQEREEKKEANNLLLIDGVNLAFRYLQRVNYNNFTDDYIRTVSSLGKSYNAKKIICCYDSGASVFRKTMFPEYKANRKVLREEEEQKRFEEFFDCLNRTIEELPFDHYKFKGIEADDLIAYFVKHFSSSFNHTWIVSSDRDLYQLLKPTTSIFNMFSRKEITLEALTEKYGLTPSEYMLARIIQGDAGDNIRGIEGIGEKRSTDLAREYKKLDTLISSLPIKSKAKYIQNLNAGAEVLLANEKLINLLTYNEAVLDSVEKSDSVKQLLKKAINEI